MFFNLSNKVLDIYFKLVYTIIIFKVMCRGGD